MDSDARGAWAASGLGITIGSNIQGGGGGGGSGGTIVIAAAKVVAGPLA